MCLIEHQYRIVMQRVACRPGQTSYICPDEADETYIRLVTASVRRRALFTTTYNEDERCRLAVGCIICVCLAQTTELIRFGGLARRVVCGGFCDEVGTSTDRSWSVTA